MKLNKRFAAGILSVVLASQAFAVAASAASLANDPNYVYISTRNAYFLKSECIYTANGLYIPYTNATPYYDTPNNNNSSTSYKEMDANTVCINGKYYFIKDCSYNYSTRQYVPNANAKSYNNYYYSYAEYGNQVYVNGKYYNKTDCVQDGDRYYPKNTSDSSTIYKVYDKMVCINGVYYNLTDCTRDDIGRYIPYQNAIGYSNYYSEYQVVDSNTVKVNGHYYSISNCIKDKDRYYPIDVNRYNDNTNQANYKEFDKMVYINGKYYLISDCYKDTNTNRYAPYNFAKAYSYLYNSYADYGNQVYVNGKYYSKSDCIADNDRYYPKSEIDSNTSYKVRDNMVYIDGYYYLLTECYKDSTGRYVPYNTAKKYTYYYSNYKMADSNVVYVNGHYYRITDCVLDNDRYYPKTGASNVDSYYSDYKEYEYMVYINGKYYNKTDCSYDTTYKRYSPKTGAKGYSNNYTSYIVYSNDIVMVNGKYYYITDCVKDNDRYFPKSGAQTVDDYDNSGTVSSDDPYLYNNTKTKGWSALIRTMKNASSGSTTKISMNKTYNVTKAFLNSFAGTNKKVQLVMPNGSIWEISGNSVTSSVADTTNIKIQYNTTDIPAGLKKAADSLAESYAEVTIGDSQIKSFGFTGRMTVKFKQSTAGKVAKIFRFDPENHYLIRTDYATIDSNGYVTFNVDTSGIYALIIMKNQG